MSEPEELSLIDEVLALVGEGRFRAALMRLRLSDGTELSAADRGRAMAIAVACLSALGQQEQVQTTLAQTLADNSIDFEFMVALGNQLSDLGEHEPAAMVLEDLLQRDDKSHVPPFNLAVLRVRQERLDDALTLYQIAIARRHDFAPALLGKADCLRQSGHLAQAAAAYRRYLHLVPDDTDYWVTLAIVESELGNFDIADRVYAHAQSLDDQSVMLYYNWAVTAGIAGDGDRLTTCLERLDEVAPEDWRTLVTRSFKAESEGNVWLGWEACQEAVDAALQIHDIDSAEAATLTALRFAERHEMNEQGLELAERVFDANLHTPAVFDAYRILQGQTSDQAVDYLVTLHGLVRDEEVISTMADEEEKGGPPFNFYRSYRVFAETEDQAAQAAIDFESRHGEGGEVQVDSIEEEASAASGCLGIIFRSDMHVYSVNQTETE